MTERSNRSGVRLAELVATSALAGLPANKQGALAPAVHAIIVSRGALSFVETTSFLLIAGWLALAVGSSAAPYPAG